MSREKLVTIVLAPLALLVVSGVVLPLVLEELKASPAADVRVGDVVVTTSESGVVEAEFALHNAGESSAILQRVGFEIDDFAHLPTCHTEGELGVAKRFGVALPLRAAQGQRVASPPLRRQLGPDEAERLAFRFTLAEGGERNTGVYRLRPQLWHDGKAEPTALGDVVVSAGAGAGGQVFQRTSSDPTGTSWFGLLYRRTLRCMRDNTIRLDRMLAYPGPKPEWLTELRGALLSPSEAKAAFAKFGRCALGVRATTSRNDETTRLGLGTQQSALAVLGPR